MRVIALIDDPRVVRRILEHLGRWAPEEVPKLIALLSNHSRCRRHSLPGSIRGNTRVSRGCVTNRCLRGYRAGALPGAIEFQLLVQLAGEPACDPLPRPEQLHRVEVHLHAITFGVFGRLAVGGK